MLSASTKLNASKFYPRTEKNVTLKCKTGPLTQSTLKKNEKEASKIFDFIVVSVWQHLSRLRIVTFHLKQKILRMNTALPFSFSFPLSMPLSLHFPSPFHFAPLHHICHSIFTYFFLSCSPLRSTVPRVNTQIARAST